MINIHSLMLEKVQKGEISSDDFYILICITKRISRNNCAFPSIAKLMQESNFGRDKVYKCLSNLVEQKLITKTQRRTRNKTGKEVLSSNLYKITTNLLSVFINVQNQELEEDISETTENQENISVLTDFQATDYQAPENQTRSIVHSSLSIEQVVEVEQSPTSKLKEQPPTQKEVYEHIRNLFPSLIDLPHCRLIVEILMKKQHWREYATFVQKNKANRYTDLKGWRKWFYEDYLTERMKPPEESSIITPEEEEFERMIRAKYSNYQENF